MRIGIDLGGTKVEGIALSETGEELFRHRIATPQGDYQATLQSIQSLIAEIETRCAGDSSEQASIGICTPGALSPASGLLRNSNSVCMNGKPVLDDLQTLLNREIRMANDANCFALSEATDGVAKDAAVVFGVIIGTGTGAGIVIDKKTLIGPNAIAGEWGHNPLPWPQGDNAHAGLYDERPGAECYCGKHGCIETWVSGPAITRDHAMHNNGEEVDAKTLDQRSRTGDSAAENTLQRYEDRLARSLAHVINMLDPDAIVLGGGMGNIKRLYENVPTIWRQYVFSDVVNTRLLAPKYGDSSGVRGAAWLW
jgi:fructokinase